YDQGGKHCGGEDSFQGGAGEGVEGRNIEGSGQVGKWMKTLDCRKLNEETVKTHFKMEGVRQVMESMQEGEYAMTLDLKGTFLHVKVELSLRLYMDKVPCDFPQYAEAGDQGDQGNLESESNFLYRRYSAYGSGYRKA
ncbi:MAG: hypothetical protein EZS28_030038, partial [Streblomastix strix]